MKTLYATHGRGPLRFSVTDEQVDTIDQARDRVYGLVTENPNWRPSLEIDIPIVEELGCHAENLVVNVTWGSGTRDNYHNRLSKAFRGEEDRGWVMADLGHFCYEGWESDVDGRDFSELPDVYFGKEFVWGFSRPRTWRWNSDDWQNSVLPEHQRLLIPQVYREARRAARSANMDAEYGRRDRDDATAIMKLCREVWSDKKTFNDLELQCETFRKEMEDGKTENDIDELDFDEQDFGSPERR